MKKHIVSKFIALLMCLAVILCIPLSVSAETNTATGSLTVKYHIDKTDPIKNAQFSVYLIATGKSSSSYTLTDTFSKYGVSLEKLDRDSLSGIATALSAYVARDSISSSGQGRTDDNGVVTFSNLQEGLYLVVGEIVVDGSKTYTPQSIIVPVPYSGAGGTPDYNVTVEPKCDIYDEGVKGDTVDRVVRKVWSNIGGIVHPQYVIVQLLRNGEIFEEVTLDDSNNWTYTWKDLDAEYNWQVAEKTVPDGYTVSVDQDGITFTVKNTYGDPDRPSEPESTDPNKPSNTTNPSDPTNPPNPTNPSNPTNPTNPSNPDNTTKPSPLLPQTGQLWWPVPLFIGIGIIAFVLGIAVKKRNESSEA